jgi:hypothetical protein
MTNVAIDTTAPAIKNGFWASNMTAAVLRKIEIPNIEKTSPDKIDSGTLARKKYINAVNTVLIGSAYPPSG